MIVNLPHNPTGMHVSAAEFDALVELVERHGATLVCDEVYRGLEHDPAARLPAAADRSPRAVSVGVLSKSYALAGLRVGWLATRDRDLLDAVAQVRDYTSLCSPAPSEVLGIIALRAADALLERSRGIIAANLPIVDELFAAHPERIDWVRPTAGSIGFPRYLGAEGIDAFNERLVRGAGRAAAARARVRLRRRALPARLRARQPARGGGAARPPAYAHERVRPDRRAPTRARAGPTRASSSRSSDALGEARSVVNVGAGSGAYEPRDRDVVAVEPSAVMLAQRPPGAARAIQASAEALPFEDGSFDAALAVLTMHHWATGGPAWPRCAASRRSAA